MVVVNVAVVHCYLLLFCLTVVVLLLNRCC